MSTDQLETAATALGPLLEEVVFLGGASIHLWLSDPAAPAARTTASTVRRNLANARRRLSIE